MILQAYNEYIAVMPVLAYRFAYPIEGAMRDGPNHLTDYLAWPMAKRSMASFNCASV